MMILPKDYTAQENIIAECLSELGLRYEQQADFAPYTPDFFIPEISMIIEADGKYGHLRKRDVKRDMALIKHEDIEYILHIRDFSKKQIWKQLLKAMAKLPTL